MIKVKEPQAFRILALSSGLILFAFFIWRRFRN